MNQLLFYRLVSADQLSNIWSFLDYFVCTWLALNFNIFVNWGNLFSDSFKNIYYYVLNMA